MVKGGLTPDLSGSERSDSVGLALNTTSSP